MGSFVFGGLFWFFSTFKRKDSLFVRIALVSSGSKKELMLQFCIAYSSILRSHAIFSTQFTSPKTFSDLKLVVEEFLNSRQGCIQPVAARVACDEVDLLIYFRDPTESSASAVAEHELFRLCDLHNVPFATNLATAEALVQGVKRGDFNWRNLLKTAE